ncbi:hypothetical protein ABW21_db0201752 [Orbilia brochopaga]|nr:hypothetical protein ABW21_db0201752 [Drechslerella brochopaga]
MLVPEIFHHFDMVHAQVQHFIARGYGGIKALDDNAELITKLSSYRFFSAKEEKIPRFLRLFYQFYCFASSNFEDLVKNPDFGLDGFFRCGVELGQASGGKAQRSLEVVDLGLKRHCCIPSNDTD